MTGAFEMFPRWLTICCTAALAAAGCRERPAAAPPSPSPSVRTLQEGFLTVACDVPNPPFAVEGGGGVMGFQVDLVREVANRLGLTPRILDVAAFRIHTDVANGDYDAALTVLPTTPELEELVDFSDPYFNLTLALVTSPEERPDVASSDDLALGDVVAVENGTTAEAFAERSLRPSGVEVRAYPDAGAAYTAVETGVADAVLDQQLNFVETTSAFPDLRAVQILSTGESLAVAVRPDSPALLDAINLTLQGMLEDGTYDEIYARYPELPPEAQVTEAE
jgi:polar amino acid transport system substrate-binding protein